MPMPDYARAFFEVRLEMIREKIEGKERPDQVYNHIQNAMGILNSFKKDYRTAPYERSLNILSQRFAETFPSFTAPKGPELPYAKTA